MSDANRLNSIRADLQRASTVVYLEGKTDPAVFFALLGRTSHSSIHNDVVVVGLNAQGSGRQEVRERVELAVREGLTGTPGRGGVFGIVDGDSRPYAELAADHDPPHNGPLFSWKTYCIENLLAKAGWPQSWLQPQPDWKKVLDAYAPYSALNVLHREIQAALDTLGLARFTNPQHGQPLLTDIEIKSALEKDKNLLGGRDVESDFANHLRTIRSAIAASLDQGHALVNGKWLVRHYARSLTNKSEDKCREEWCDAVRNSGGLIEVQELWQRITLSPP